MASAHTLGTSAGKPQGLTGQSSFSAFLFLTSHLPDGSTLEQTPHSSEKNRKGWSGVSFLAAVVGPVGLGGKGMTGRKRQEGGGPRYCLADFLLCRADADSSCPLPWFSDEFKVENSTYSAYPGELPEGTSLSVRDLLASHKVDLPAYYCPVHWDWPNGYCCSLLTTPFCANCPRQITKLFLEVELPECTFLP